ncbi:hypothetical protein Tco_0525519 [Tanacetum coccineum]
MFAIEKQHIVQPEFIIDTYVMEKDDSNVTPNSSNMSRNGGKVDQHAANHEDERVFLASYIEKFKVDTEENKKIHKDLKKVNTYLTQELWNYKIELERYKTV